jgi:HEAT repeat protein
VRQTPSATDFDGWVAQLGVSSCRRRARLHLIESGAPAVPAVRRGLRHSKVMVRRLCVRIFDQLVDEASLPDLVVALEDPDTEVRTAALHALACDRCKKNACRPGEDLWVPRALEFLTDHDPDVRAAAIDALGKVSGRADAKLALRTTADSDPDAGLRSMARRRV